METYSLMLTDIDLNPGRAGQIWQLKNLYRSLADLTVDGDVYFLVLNSIYHSTLEIEHEILVLNAKNFSIFESDIGKSSFWWESLKSSWEFDSAYRRIL